jgi:hypothetical protein
MGKLLGRIIGGFIIIVFLLVGISSCNLGKSTGGYDCPEGGCGGNPDDYYSEFDYVVP